MRFHRKIILVAFFVTALVAGAQALPGQERAADLVDPGYWMALGQGLMGVQEDGWCRCS